MALKNVAHQCSRKKSSEEKMINNEMKFSDEIKSDGDDDVPVSIESSLFGVSVVTKLKNSQKSHSAVDFQSSTSDREETDSRIWRFHEAPALSLLTTEESGSSWTMEEQPNECLLLDDNESNDDENDNDESKRDRSDKTELPRIMNQNKNDHMDHQNDQSNQFEKTGSAENNNFYEQIVEYLKSQFNSQFECRDGTEIRQFEDRWLNPLKNVKDRCNKEICDLLLYGGSPKTEGNSGQTVLSGSLGITIEVIRNVRNDIGTLK